MSTEKTASPLHDRVSRWLSAQQPKLLSRTAEEILDQIESALATLAIHGADGCLTSALRVGAWDRKKSRRGGSLAGENFSVVTALGMARGSELFVSANGGTFAPTPRGFAVLQPTSPEASDDDDDAIWDAAYDEAIARFEDPHEWLESEWLDETALGARLSYSMVNIDEDSGRAWLWSCQRVPASVIALMKGERNYVGKNKLYSVMHAGLGDPSSKRIGAAIEVSPNRFVDWSGKPIDTYLRSELGMAFAGAFRRRYEWNVEFSLSPGRHGICLPTDVVGADSLLRLRDVAESGRRKALVHWVRSHLRRRRREDGTSLVREHLRGALTARVGHLHARIWPSTFDLERARRTCAASQVGGGAS